MMRARHRLAAAVLTLPAACAPLIDFDALTTAHDAGVDAAEEAAQDGGVSEAPAPGDAGPSDSTSTEAPCAGKLQGYYCGSDLSGYAGSASDLVHCTTAGTVDGFDTCSQGCIVLTSGLPDTCDPCAGTGDGTWCGNQLQLSANVESYLQYVIFTCTNGKSSTTPLQCLYCVELSPGVATCSADGG
jgi:hypothetical protein